MSTTGYDPNFVALNSDYSAFLERLKAACSPVDHGEGLSSDLEAGPSA